MRSHSPVLVPDIWREICGHLQESESLGSLASLAATCKHSSEPALDALWRAIPSILTLLKTLPEDCLGVYGEKSERTLTILYFRREVTADDWARTLEFYAPRIRKVGLPESNPGYDFMVDKHTIDFVIHTIPKTCLLPSVAELTIKLTDFIPSFIYIPIIHPQLKALRIYMDESMQTPYDCKEAQSLLSHVRCTCHDLQMLSLHKSAINSLKEYTPRSQPWLDMMDFTNSTLSGFKQLMQLTLTITDDTFIPTLFELLNLQRLHLTVMEYRPDSDTRAFLQTAIPRLPCLRDLHLTTASVLPFYEDFMPCIQRSRAIDTISVDIRALSPYASSPAFWPALFQHVGKLQSLHNLALIGVFLAHPPSYPTGDPYVTNILKPLYSITGMRRFCMQSSLSIPLGRALKDISAAWPQLRTLCLNMGHAYISIAALRHLAFNCPRLSSISLNLDAYLGSRDPEVKRQVRQCLAIPAPPHNTPIEFSFYTSSFIGGSESEVVADILLHMFEKGSFGILPTKPAWKKVAESCLEGNDAQKLTSSVRWNFDLDALLKRRKDEPAPAFPDFIQRLT